MIFIQQNESFGYLRVITRTARGALPVENVLVTITSYDGANSKVVASSLSDANGMTPPARLSAPAPENSQSPGAGPPFTSYNVDADIDGYYPVRNIGAQVYPGITSVQPVELIPIALGTPAPPAPISEISFENNQAPDL